MRRGVRVQVSKTLRDDGPARVIACVLMRETAF